MTNVNIVSGNLTGVTVNGTITIATLGGSMNANNQIISNVNIDSGDISNVNITANSIKGPGILEDIDSAAFNIIKISNSWCNKKILYYKPEVMHIRRMYNFKFGRMSSFQVKFIS